MKFQTRDLQDEQVVAALKADPHYLPPDTFPPLNPSFVIDCGCWIGYTTLAYANLWPEADILAFEAQADNAEMAKKNCAPFPWIKVVNAAVGIPGHAYLSSRAMNMRSLRGDGTDPEVTLVQALDPLLVEHGYSGRTIDFIKFDVEGVESECLEGEWPHRTSTMLIDLHNSGDSVVERLKHYGFKCVPLPPTAGAADGRLWAWRG